MTGTVGDVPHYSTEDLGFFVVVEIDRRIEQRFDSLEAKVTALSDAIAAVQADDAEIQADVVLVQNAQASNATAMAALQAQIATLEAGGTVTQDQIDALNGVASDLATAHNAIDAALPAPGAPATTTPAPAPEPAPAPAPAPAPDGGGVPPTSGTGDTTVTEPAPAPATFVAKVDGETYADYVNRTAAWNADPANASALVTAVDEATWDALPVG